MASGFAKDPVYGLPYSGTKVTTAPAVPRTQTVLNMNSLTRETITITAGDDHYTTASSNSQRVGDHYHE